MTLAELVSAAGPDAGPAGDGDPGEDGRPVEDGRILVVDDDPYAATLMCRLIEREGFSSVRAAGDGRRALEMIMEQPPDVVVLDVHLPKIDGFAVLREIVRNDERSGRPTGVLGVSGDPTDATGESMMWAGADDFIPRPFESAEFVERVRRLAARTRALRRALAYLQFVEDPRAGLS